jgi:hypothetical protein
LEIIEGIQEKSWLIMIYGVPGVGKSTLAKFAPEPVFLNLENGLDRIDCAKTKHLRDWNSFFDAMKWAKDCKYQTIVLDTGASIEEMLIKQMLDEVNQDNKGKLCQSINDNDFFPYGAGSVVLKAKWAMVMNMFYKLKEIGKNVILIAHEQIQRVPNPQGEDYDRFSPNLNKKSLEMIISQMDGVFFCHHERVTGTKKGPMGKDIKFMYDTKKRVIQTQEKLTALAKNRFPALKGKDLFPFNNMKDCENFFDGIR